MVNFVGYVIVNPATPLFSTPFHPAHYFQPYLSVDRCGMLKHYETLLYNKAQENANPAGERFPYGYCVGRVEQIRSIQVECEGPQQAFEIYPDPILDNDPPREWDHAHALIVRFSDKYTRSLVRGVRDRLVEVFLPSVKQFK